MDLYCHVPPLGENIPVSIDPFLVKDSVPTENNIEWAVKRLQNHRSGAPSGMQVEHLKGWLEEARKEDAAEEKAAVTEGTT